MNATKNILYDKDGNEFYPKTVTSNVYTEDGARLDVLNTITTYRGNSTTVQESQTVATKNNNIAYVSVNIALSGSFTSGEALLTNFPTPFAELEVVISSASDNIRAKLKTNGYLCIDGAKTVSSRTWYSAMFSYPIAR